MLGTTGYNINGALPEAKTFCSDKLLFYCDLILVLLMSS